MENSLDRITSSPDVAFGKPVIKGTRMAVIFLLEHLAASDSHEEILEAFPYLKKKMF